MAEIETALACDQTSVLGRIPSVHSMRDIPFAYADTSSAAVPPLDANTSKSTIDSNHSSRLISVDFTVPPAPKHSSVIRTDDLHSLHKTRTRLMADIDIYGPASINAIILASVFERIRESFLDVLPLVFGCEDPTQFSAQFYPLRNILLHLGKAGPMGSIFPNASRLNHLIKWDFRQLINSFITLLRTSPGFVATAYLELSVMDRKLFLGYQNGDWVEDVMSAQRLSPLGILFHGMIRDKTERINYFAAVSAQLLLDEHEQLFQCVLSKYTKRAFFPSDGTPKLNILLQKFLKSGHDSPKSATSTTVNTCTSTTASISITTPQDSEFWNEHCARFLPVLREFIPAEFAQFVATVCELAPTLTPRIHSAAIKHFKTLIRQVITNPHSFGLLEDQYVSDQAQKCLLAPLVTFLHSAIDTNDGFIAALCGTDIQLGDINSYYEKDQLVVLSLSDIVFIYGALLPKRASSPVPPNDDNEWCLDNIQADLEPVMKELSVKLPTVRNRIVKDQQGIFMEYWQVFKIEQDGLVNDMDSNSWCPEVTGGISRLVVPPYADVTAVLDKSIAEAESRAQFVDAQALRKLRASENPLNAVVHELEKCAQLYTSHKQELHVILDLHTEAVYDLKQDLERVSHSLSVARVFIWYEQEVRNSPLYLRSQEVVALLKGKLSLQRSNSGSSSISSRRYSARPRRLSILSGASVMDSFYVSKDYLLKPKLADREIEVAMKFLRSEHVHNFCRSEELIHRFNCEVFLLLNRLLDRDFLSSASTTYKKDVKAQTHTPSSHRMSMSVLPDMSSGARSRNRKSSPNLLLDIFEWKSSDHQLPADWSMGLEHDALATAPERDTLAGLLLSDLGAEFLLKGSETDEFMQQTGRMLLDGDGQTIQPILEHISLHTTPLKKLKGIQSLMQFVRAEAESDSAAGSASRHDVTYELSKLLGREPGTLFADLQIVSGFVPSSVLESVDEGQPFWDVAEAAIKILDHVVGKSMDLATRMLRYNETVKSTSLVTAMGVNDAVSIWSFCARHGRPKAQRKLAELYLSYQHTVLEVMPFTKPAILFEGIEPGQVRNVVVAHWMQIAAQKGEPKAIEYCRQLQRVDFI